LKSPALAVEVGKVGQRRVQRMPEAAVKDFIGRDRPGRGERFARMRQARRFSIEAASSHQREPRVAGEVARRGAQRCVILIDRLCRELRVGHRLVDERDRLLRIESRSAVQGAELRVEVVEGDVECVLV